MIYNHPIMWTPCDSLWKNRGLIKALVGREVIGRYRGSMMGVLWSFFLPVMMLAVYTFVFSVIFKARWDTGSDSKTEFALILFAGLLVFNFFSECVNRAPGLILANTSYVKKVVFPLEILPVVTLGAALFHCGVGLSVWFLFYMIFFGVPPLTALLFPVVLLPLLFLTAGVSWLLASLGVFLRDVAQVVGVVTTMLLFLSPIFYPISALPEEFRTVLVFNPLAHIIEQTRGVLIFGRMPNWNLYGVSLIGSLVVAWLGYLWFQKTRKGFADVL
ncbi:MAG: ABC transporter permease [Proteobacteria bacterium]|nr:ABC transporter permease [Pseudomonadota bacterium]MCL2308639.1 ABC transporter permease [Pseudomonadota bacterium]